MATRKTYSVQGTICTPAGQPLPGLTVGAFDQDPNTPDNPLGQAVVTDAKGKYAITYNDEDFRLGGKESGGADIIVRVYEKGFWVAETEPKWNAEETETIDVEVDADISDFSNTPRILRGRIVHQNGHPLKGVVVKGFAKRLSSQLALGDALTNSNGEYIIHYTSEQADRQERRSLNLFITVSTPQGEPLGSSEESILFHAGHQETIDLAVNHAAFRGPCEYQHLTGELSTALQEKPLIELTDQDINFLAKDTGVDALRIRPLRQAARLADALRQSPGEEVPDEVLYALTQQSSLTEPSDVLRRDRQSLRQTLDNAVEENQIPDHLQDSFDTILDRLDDLAIEQELDKDDSLGALLRTSPVLAERRDPQKAFARIYFRHAGSLEAFWQRVEAQPELKEHQNALKSTMQLGELAQNHIPLVQTLQTALRQNKENPDARDLAGWDEQQWRGTLANVAQPADIAGAKSEDPVGDYARVMMQRVEATFPTAVLAHGIVSAERPDEADLRQFLTNSGNAEFHFGRTRIDDYLAEQPEERLSGIQDRETLQRDLKHWQRLYRVVPESERFPAIRVLQQDHIDSAGAIARMGQAAFIEQYSAALGGEDRARTTWNKASQTSAMALILFAGYSTTFQGATPQVVPRTTVEDTQGLANWENLFGSLDFCECEHCQSVYSPAAYFVDLLQFLKNASKKYGKSPLDVLLSRRPDLTEIELSCENTNTLMPYVDLVNEILEDAVSPWNAKFLFTVTPKESQTANQMLEFAMNVQPLPEWLTKGFKENGYQLSSKANLNGNFSLKDHEVEYRVAADDTTNQLTVLVKRHHQTRRTQDELSAFPEHLNQLAYWELAGAMYPWNLPFDLWWEEARVYFHHLEFKRYAWMETLIESQSRNPPTLLDVACDYLGITAYERRRIIGDLAQPEYELWGMEQTDWDEKLRNVSIFLRQAGFASRESSSQDFKDARQLLVGSRYVNPHNTVSISVGGNCELETARILNDPHLGANERQACWQKIVNRARRFLHVQRKLGWTTIELDKAIAAFGADLDAEKGERFLQQLAQVERLRKDLKVPLIEILSWWGPLDTAEDRAEPNERRRQKSLYERVFLDKSIDPSMDKIFALNVSRMDLAYLSFHISAELGEYMFPPEIPEPIRQCFEQRGYPLDENADKVQEEYAHWFIVDPELEKGYLIVPEENDELAVFGRTLEAELGRITDFLFRLPPGFRSALGDGRINQEIRQVFEQHGYPLSPGADFAWNGEARPLWKIFDKEKNHLILREEHGFAVCTTWKISACAAGIAAALEISTADVSCLVESLAQDGRTDWLDLETLSQLYRMVSLSKALKLSLKDFLAVKALTGIDPYQSTANTLTFLEKVRKIQASDFSIAELNYLLRHQFETPNAIVPNERDILLFVRELRSALIQLAAETAPAADPQGILIKTRLSTLLPADRLNDVFDVISGDSLKKEPEQQKLIGELKPYLDVDEAGSKLVGQAALADKAKRFAYILTALRPYLSENLIKEQLGAALGLEAEISDLLLTRFVNGRLHKDTRMLYDFLALAPGGLQAEYYSNATFEGKATPMPIGETINFQVIFKLTKQSLVKLGKEKNIPDEIVQSLEILENQGFTNEKDFLRAVQKHIGDKQTVSYKELILKQVNFQWSQSSLSHDPQISPGIPFSVRWQGMLQLRQTGSYIFHIEAEGQVTLSIDNQEHVNKSGSIDIDTTIALEAGRYYDIQVEYYTTTGKGGLTLSWTCPSTPREIIPASAFVSSDVVPACCASYRLLHKLAMLIATFGIQADELRYLSEHSDDFEQFDLNRFPITPGPDHVPLFIQWEHLYDLFRFRNHYRYSDTRLLDVLADAGRSANEARNTLAAFTGWDSKELEALTGPEGCKLSQDDYRQGRKLNDLHEAFKRLRQLGISAQQFLDWIRTDPGTSLTDSAASAFQKKQALVQELKQVVKAKYDQQHWLKIAKPLRDALREKQRAALVAYLLHEYTLEQADQLYAHFLIDVEMSPCMMTSRIKQAISSVQLFVQRSLMSLEPNVSLSPQIAEEWKWRKNYRVWEANRKVFLYPENWIEPELRDDKSPFFEDLENELLQNEITKGAAESAFLSYLDKLDEVARLEIAGMYLEEERNIMHVFGRTRNLPHVYYYRRWIDKAYWTPWERVDLDIEGDHLIPVVWNGRVHLFWPIFEKQQEQDKTGQYLNELVLTEKSLKKLREKEHLPDYIISKLKNLLNQWFRNEDEFFRAVEIELGQEKKDSYKEHIRRCAKYPDDNPPSFNFWEIRLAWSEYRQEKWSAKRTCPTTLSARYISEQDPYSSLNKPIRWEAASCCYPIENYLFKALNINNILRIRCFSISSLSLDRGYQSLNFPIYFQAGYPIADFCFPRDDNSVELSEGYEQLEIRQPILRPGKVYEQHDVNDPLYISKHMAFVRANGENSITHLTLPFSENENNTSIKTLNELENLRLSLFPLRSVLKTSSSKFRLFPPHQYLQFNSLRPFFYEDDLRTFLVRKEGGSWMLSGIPESGGSIKIQPRYSFQTFYHPYIPEFVSQIRRWGIDGLLAPAPDGEGSELLRQGKKKSFFKDIYGPESIKVEVNGKEHKRPSIVNTPYPIDEIDFSPAGSYAHYNWELFFHIPLLIADSLGKNQRFEEAVQWFHYMFDPTTADQNQGQEPKTSRFWKVRPFYEFCLEEKGRPKRIQDLMLLLNKGDQEMEKQVKQWCQDPFKPHLIARLRMSAYMKNVVMKYIDTLIAWGDQLFRRDTIESLNEATQLYILAAEILGERPRSIPAQTRKNRTFSELEEHLDEFSNALENELPESLTDWNGSGYAEQETLTLDILHFCIPHNDKLLEYWDTVADRLFKIRHCMNIEGVKRQLPLFQPPIDPALLVRAAAMGIDIGSVLNDLHAPLPHYRFQIMLQKTIEICADVRSLGAALLSALEKKDAEELSLLRSQHEIKILKAVREIKKAQIGESEKTLEGLQNASEQLIQQKTYYTNLIQNGLSVNESLQLEKLQSAHAKQFISQMYNVAASVAHMFPTITYTQGVTPEISTTFGGPFIGRAYQAFSNVASMLASVDSYEATKASITGGHDRRNQEWQFKLDQTTIEEEQINKKIAAAEIRLAITEKELENHDLQAENAKETDSYMRSKFTNKQLYNWMVSQISALYFQSYKMAYDLAKQAEKAFQYELGIDDTHFVQFGYWDSLKKGLLAGEKLHHDLKRMEVAYMEQNRREYEISKHVSLALLDPEALVHLKETGECYVSLPEAIFDLDYPGHYMRRIKSVSLTIPCVTGPYTSVNCTLTLHSNRIRKSTSVEPEYAWSKDSNDDRFLYNSGGMQSIATSRAQEDSGVFELNFRDERYLPFEGTGAISTWHLELPQTFRQFDYDTISDVIFHLRYTARDGGATLKKVVQDDFEEALNKIGLGENADERTGLSHLFSARHDFPTEWHRFFQLVEDKQEGETTVYKHKLRMTLSPERFPFQFSQKKITLTEMTLFMRLDIDMKKFHSFTYDLFSYDEKGNRTSQIQKNPDKKEAASNEFAASGPFKEKGIVTAKPFTKVEKELDAKEEWSFDMTTIPPFLQDSGPVIINNEEHERLDPALIDDLWVLCKYSVTEKKKN